MASHRASLTTLRPAAERLAAFTVDLLPLSGFGVGLVVVVVTPGCGDG
jgi:hypothetical protein